MGGSPFVLVVEDEWLIRAALASALEDAGWQVLETSRGEEAIKLLSEPGRHIRMLITDIRLAGQLTGWDVAEAFRKAYPASAIFYTSANTEDRSRQVPGTVFIPKPYDMKRS